MSSNEQVSGGGQRRETIAAVITNYRHREFLPAAVDSVLAQTRPVDRIIVVDDASGAAEADVLDALSRRVEVIRLEGNVGAGGARQAGTDVCDCDLVAYLDADDLWEPTKIERQYAHLRAAGDASGSHTGTVVFDASGHEREFVDVKPLELDLRTQLCRNQVAPPTVMLRTAAVRSVGGWEPGTRLVEDWDMFIRMAAAGLRIVGLREALTRVRRTGHSHLSSSGIPQIRRLMNTLDRHAELVKSQLGEHGLAGLRREQMMSHRHTLSIPHKLRVMAAATVAGASMPRQGWNWLL